MEERRKREKREREKEVDEKNDLSYLPSVLKPDIDTMEHITTI